MLFVGVFIERWQVSLDWEHQVNNLAKKFSWRDLQ